MQKCNLWDKITLRLKSLCFENRGAGCAWVSVDLLINNGELVGWRKPGLVPTEPYSQRDEIAKVAISECEPIDKGAVV